MAAAKTDAGNTSQKKKKTGVKGFFRGVWSELKKVHWPSRKQLVTYTCVVIVTVLVLSLAISAMDWAVSSLFRLVIK